MTPEYSSIPDNTPVLIGSAQFAGRIVTYSVNFNGSNHPQAIILAETDNRERFVACTAPDDQQTANQLLESGNENGVVAVTAAEGETLHFKLER